MNEYKAVYSVSGMIQAMAIRFSLEQAGIPSKLTSSRDDCNLTILVPAVHQYNAVNVLYPTGRVADILAPRK
jgi:hypothetical protein